MKNIHILQENIYITSYEKFVRNEYITDGIKVMKATQKLVDAQGLVDRRDWKKIILTTDQDLIKDGVQATDDEFLEWFVKNPSCEEVEVELEIIKRRDTTLFVPPLRKYKIIIPKEEPKQETVEEASTKYADNNNPSKDKEDACYWYASWLGFRNGAKWQQERMYSEEEVKRLAFKFYLEMSKQMNVPDNLITENYTNVDEWFEQLNPIKAY